MSNDGGIGAGGSAAPWYRVVAIPDAGYGGAAERDYAAVLPAVLDAAQARRSFVSGWFSRGGGAPLELITNAGPLPSAAGPRQTAWTPATSRAATAPATGAAPAPAPAKAPAGQHPYGPPGEFLVRLASEIDQQPRHCELLFPWGARGVPLPEGVMADLDAMVWAPCPGRLAPPLPADSGSWQGSGWAAGQHGQGGQGGHAGGGASWLAAAGGGLAGSAPTLFESALTTLMGRPFGWLVEPSPAT